MAHTRDARRAARDGAAHVLYAPAGVRGTSTQSQARSAKSHEISLVRVGEEKQEAKFPFIK